MQSISETGSLGGCEIVFGDGGGGVGGVGGYGADHHASIDPAAAASTAYSISAGGGGSRIGSSVGGSRMSGSLAGSRMGSVTGSRMSGVGGSVLYEGDPVPESSGPGGRGDYSYAGGEGKEQYSQYLEQGEEEEEEDPYAVPSVSVASWELDTARWNQRRHISFIEQSTPGKKGANDPDIPLPSIQSFPRDCLHVVRLLDGNDLCVDCDLPGAEGSVPLWASISHGTLLCDKCAFVHITKSEEKNFKHMGQVKHLETGYWSLPEILQMLEGGNGNFLRAIQANRGGGRLERMGAQRLSSVHKLGSLNDGLNPIAEEEEGGGNGNGTGSNATFDFRYRGKAAASYCAALTRRTEAVCEAFECYSGLPDNVAHDLMGADLFHKPVPVSAFRKKEDARHPDDVMSRTGSKMTARTASMTRTIGTSRRSSNDGSLSTRQTSWHQSSSAASLRRTSNESSLLEDWNQSAPPSTFPREVTGVNGLNEDLDYGAEKRSSLGSKTNNSAADRRGGEGAERKSSLGSNKHSGASMRGGGGPDKKSNLLGDKSTVVGAGDRRGSGGSDGKVQAKARVYPRARMQRRLSAPSRMPEKQEKKVERRPDLHRQSSLVQPKKVNISKPLV